MNKQRESKKIRQGDKVIVRAGNDRGQLGTVLKVLGNKAIVQGINVRKKHVKRSQTSPQGIIEFEKPVHISNLQVCTENGTPVKLKLRFNEQGQKEFYYRLNDEDVLYRAL
jgi:large subunit ribosomal protein L24